MPGRKKSRKTGPIGVRKSTAQPTDHSRSSNDSPRRKKKSSSGKPAGSRHSIRNDITKTDSTQTKKDPRLGSKKPIPLIKESGSSAFQHEKTVYFSPREELIAIENDERLSALLDKVENDEVMDDADAVYFETKMQRHAQLCALLGIEMDDNDDPDAGDDVNL
jgi:hypothetical protein